MAGFSILAKLGLDSSPMTAGLASAKSKLKGFASSIANVVKTGMIAAGVAVTAFAIKGTVDLIDFKKKMAEVFTLIPGISKQAMDAMEGDMRRVAVTMGVDLIKSVDGLYAAISSGVPPQNAVQFLADASKLAIVGVTDLESAVGATTTVMDAFKIETEEMGRVSDVLFSIVQGGIINFDELATHIGKATTPASQLGLTLEDLGAATRIMTRTLGKGQAATALTQLKEGFRELDKAGTSADLMFRSLAQGRSVSQFIAEGNTFGDALKLMGTHAETSEVKLKNLFQSANAGEAIMLLAGNQGRDFAIELGAIGDMAGIVDNKFVLMEQTVSRKTARLKASFNDLGLKMGAAFIPMLDRLMPQLTAALERLPAILAGTTGSVTAMDDAIKELEKTLSTLITLSLLVANALGNIFDVFVALGDAIGVFAEGKETLGDWTKALARFSPNVVAHDLLSVALGRGGGAEGGGAEQRIRADSAMFAKFAGIKDDLMKKGNARSVEQHKILEDFGETIVEIERAHRDVNKAVADGTPELQQQVAVEKEKTAEKEKQAALVEAAAVREKEILDLQQKIEKAVKAEVDGVERLQGKLKGVLNIEEKREAKHFAAAAHHDREAAALQAKAVEAGGDVDKLKRFFARVEGKAGQGPRTVADFGEMHKEFLKLQGEGALPEGVKTMFDFEMHLKKQAKEAVKKRQDAVAAAAAARKEALWQRNQAEASAKEIKKIKDEQKKADELMVEAQKNVQKETQKTVAQLTKERKEWQRLEAAMKAGLPGAGIAKPAVPVVAALNAQGRDLNEINKGVATLAEKGPGTLAGVPLAPTGGEEVTLPGEGGGVGAAAGGDEVTIPGESAMVEEGALATEQTLGDVLDTLDGFFVNQ